MDKQSFNILKYQKPGDWFGNHEFEHEMDGGDCGEAGDEDYSGTEEGALVR